MRDGTVARLASKTWNCLSILEKNFGFVNIGDGTGYPATRPSLARVHGRSAFFGYYKCASKPRRYKIVYALSIGSFYDIPEHGMPVRRHYAHSRVMSAFAFVSRYSNLLRTLLLLLME